MDYRIGGLEGAVLMGIGGTVTYADSDQQLRLPSVIVGYGKAGRGLHHPALLELYGRDQTVYVVDSAVDEPPPGVRLVSGVTELADLGLHDAVYHVTTPPRTHLACVEELIEAGAHRIIVEKPIAPTSWESRQLCQLAEYADILPVSVWPNSKVTEKVLSVIRSGEIGKVITLYIEQSKPRFGRTQSSDAHRTAFEVELPHQMLLALHLAGAQARLLSSLTWPLPLPAPQDAIASMGGALVRVEHASGVVSTLLSDLTSPVRRRHLRVTGTAGEICADYPITAEDPFGQLRISGQLRRHVIEDAPLTQFIRASYSYFMGSDQLPPAGLTLHSACVDLLETALEASMPYDEQQLVLG